MDVNTAAEQVVAALRDRGFLAYFAGGCVRDIVMGVAPKDYDIATNATPDQVQATFPRTMAVGKAFGVIIVIKGKYRFEVATFRSDGTYSDSRRPDSVTFGSIEEDAQRRDITINGLFYCPVEQRVLDFVGGQRDIAAGVIRAIGDPFERFAEDALRMLRVIRFAARFGFQVDDATLAAIKAYAANITKVSAERIGDETTKILTSAHPAQGLALLETSGLLALLYPEIARLRSIEQPKKYHPEGDVLTHVANMLALTSNPAPELAWSIVFHDAGKAETQSLDPTGAIHFYGHPAKGREIARRILQAYRCSNALCEIVCGVVERHQDFLQVRQMRLATLKRFLSLPYFNVLLELHRLDALSNGRSLEYHEYCLRKLSEIPGERRNPPPLITGADLIAKGVDPGPEMGRMLQHIRELQLDEILSSKEAALAQLFGEPKA